MLSQSRVLVVDDETVQRRWVSLALSRAGWDVIEAEDGDAAIDAVGKGGVSLVLMDMQLPGIDGLAATASIRAMPGPESRVPILAFTATPVSDGGQRFRAAGMDGYIVKPTRPAELAETIEPWRPSGAPLPAKRLEPLIGAAELRSMIGRLRDSLVEALAGLEIVEGRAALAHKLAGLAGTLGFADISRDWLALSEGDESALEPARRSARLGIAAIDRELESVQTG